MSKPILFSIIGAITGLIVSQVSHHSHINNIEFILFSFCLLVTSFTLLWDKVSNAILIKSLCILGLTLSVTTFYYFFQGYESIHRTDLTPAFIFGLIQITSLCTTFFQSWKTNKPYYHYDDLFENAWNNHFFYIFSGILTGAFLLILGLGGLLFDTLGFDVSDWIWDDKTTPIIIGALLGAGIGISRDYDQLIYKFRSIFFALFKVLAYLTAAILILFALVLPFFIRKLFEHEHTSQILLSIVAISILLLNALKDTEFGKSSKLPKRIFNTQIILLPIFTALSMYAISLRIEQYGLMPYRIIALWIALLIGAHTLGYLIQLIKNKGEWTLGFARINPPLAFLWVISIILLCSPVLDPVKLSVNNQVARLKNNIVEPDKFDFYALKHRLGDRGEKALEDISKWEDHPQIEKIKELVKNPKITSPGKTLSITLIGEAPENLETLKKNYSSWRCNTKSPCFIKQMKLNDDGNKQPMVFYFQLRGKNTYKMFTDYYQYDQHWKKIMTLTSESFKEEDLTKMIKSIKTEEPKLIQPTYLDFELNGIKVSR